MLLRQKFYLAFGVIALLSVCLAVYGTLALSATGDLVSRLYDQPLMGLSYARAASATLNEARGTMDRNLLLGPGMAPDAIASLHSEELDIVEELRVVRQRVQDPAVAHAVDVAQASITGWFHSGKMILGPTDGGITALPLPYTIGRRGAVAAANLNEVVEMVTANGYTYRSHAAAEMRAASATLISLCAGIIATSVLFALLFSHLLIRPIRAAIRIAEDVADGNVATVAATTRRDEIGRLLICLATMQTSLRRRALEALTLLQEKDHTAGTLKQTNSLFEAALSNMSHGLVMSDANGRVVISNRRFCDLFGLDANAVIIGKNHYDVLAHGHATANIHEQACDNELLEHLQILNTHRRGTAACSLAGCKTILITYEPTPDGGCIATHEDITERQKSEEQIVFLARHDALTCLPNRMLFQERLEQALARSERAEPFAFLYLDLDQFKNVNDALGHPIGDALLCQVGARLQGAVREGDTVARLGGDEFAILQLRVNVPTDATTLARRLVQIISEPYEIDGNTVTIGTSIGIALAPADGVHPAQLMKHADLALYRAKRQGRGTWRFFEATMDTVAQARRVLELDLRSPDLFRELELYYQPVVCSRTRRLNGFEALLRWNHPARGLVPPGDFISIAEEIGMIVPIGAWALKQACAEAATWPGDLTVAVNLSPAQFRGDVLISTIIDALQFSGLAAERLCLEITETVILEENQTTRRVLHSLRGLGTRIALDDFGTGYSSLSYLRSFPFDTIKIDRSFITEIQTRAECIAIVRAVTGLGRSLNMNTIAEGVETEAQFEILAREGCNEIQGYLFSKPMPASALPSLIKKLSRSISTQTA